MASLRGSVRILKSIRPALNGQKRNLTTGGPVRKSLAPVLLGTVAAGAGAYGLYKYVGAERKDIAQELNRLVPRTVSAASAPASQPSVFSPGKENAVYLWIYLKPTANAKEVAKVVSKLNKFCEQITDMKDEDEEILAGVGFGPNFYRQVAGKNTNKDFTYAHRKGNLGDMPSSGGDVFIHAKCSKKSQLFDLVQTIMRNMPKDSVESFEDIYSFVYRNGRDLSGFIDGTENAADEDDRRNIAVEKETGGSYVITQKWIHDLDCINTEKEKTQEAWVGRTRPDSIELSRKTVTSHVARMTGGNSYQQKKKFEIVRQSMPFGSISGDSGLFFIGYSASPENLNFMLDRMVGAGGDPHCDDIMRLSKNTKGTYWYFPGAAELKKME